MKQFDFTNVLRAFLNHEYEDRAALVTELGAAVRAPDVTMKHLLAQITEECINQPGCSPAITVQVAVMYGTVLGVLLERERADRRRKCA